MRGSVILHICFSVSVSIAQKAIPLEKKIRVSLGANGKVAKVNFSGFKFSRAE